MINITDPVTEWAFFILISVIFGTFLLIAVAVFRRGQQIRHARYVHSLQRKYRPVVARRLAGRQDPAGVEALRTLSRADLELLLDPLFTRRRITPRSRFFLLALCAELGLTMVWQRRVANGGARALGIHPDTRPDPPPLRHLLRAKSLRNLGVLRHQASWPLMVEALNDRHPDIQAVALRALADLAVPESFPVLRDRLHAVALGRAEAPPMHGLRAALGGYGLDCAPALQPSLAHSHHQIRLQALDVLRTMVSREAARRPGLTLTAETLSPPLVELLLGPLAADSSAEIRGRVAEVAAYLADGRAGAVLRKLLLDRQWFVRLRAVRALARGHSSPHLPHLEIRDCLRDPHWRVREAAIQALLAMGAAGRLQLYEHFLVTPDAVTRRQIVEVIERTGVMAKMVEEYSRGIGGVGALMVEQLAGAAAPLGLSGVLRTLDADLRQSFLDRFLPNAEAKMRYLGEARPDLIISIGSQPSLRFPSGLAA